MGEGGGQVIRSAVALSLVTGTPVRLQNIRAGRSKPGVLRQHHTALAAAATISNGTLDGGAVGDTSAEFSPGRVVPGDYEFAVGSAGSTTLVFQTILPALLLVDRVSTITLSGGTHNPWAPPVDYLAQVFAPLLERMGGRIEIETERYGFAPAGGGQWRATVHPLRSWKELQLHERGDVHTRRATILIANLPGGRAVAERERRVLVRRLNWRECDVTVQDVPNSAGPGNVILCTVESDSVTEMGVAFGQLGVRAESVARAAANQVRAYLTHDAPVGEHLADQLMLPLTLAGKGSFVTGRLSRHATTNRDVLAMFDVAPLRIESYGARTQRVFVG